jgi:O-methyltransferase involved in polyketide biosynthesis
LVIIGAGYDTRAYRIPGVRETIRVFEVDHPLTPAVKTQTIEAIFGELPNPVTHVPVVFGEERFVKSSWSWDTIRNRKPCSSQRGS